MRLSHSKYQSRDLSASLTCDVTGNAQMLVTTNTKRLYT